MGDELPDCAVITDDKAAELPLVPEHLGQRESVRRGGDFVQGVESAHQRGGARIDGCFERRQVDLAKRALRHVHGVVVPPAFRRSVGDVVLRAGGNGIGRVQPRAFVSAHVGAGNRGAKVGVFARAFHNAAPAGIAGDIDHGGEGPPDAGRRGFASGHARRALDQIRVPSGSHSERYRERGSVTVDHVESEEHGNA